MAFDIQDLKQDEVEAIEGYHNFLKYYGSQITKRQLKTIQSIIRDERRHIQLLNKIKEQIKPI